MLVMTTSDRWVHFVCDVCETCFRKKARLEAVDKLAEMALKDGWSVDLPDLVCPACRAGNEIN